MLLQLVGIIKIAIFLIRHSRFIVSNYGLQGKKLPINRGIALSCASLPGKYPKLAYNPKSFI